MILHSYITCAIVVVFLFYWCSTYSPSMILHVLITYSKDVVGLRRTSYLS